MYIPVSAMEYKATDNHSFEQPTL